MRPIIRKLGLAALGCIITACTQEVAEDPAAAGEWGEQATELFYESQQPSLRGATRSTLVDGITAAENQLFTSTGRLLVSGDEGIYEIVASPNGGHQSLPVHTGEKCFFGGLTEQAGTIYANCYDFTDSALFASPLSEKLAFRAIHRLQGTALANGLTSDGKGSLFVASSFDGRIIRLRVAARDPLSIAAQEVFDRQSGLLTNGLSYYEQNLYWTAFTSVNVAPVSEKGRKRTLGSALTFFDDLYVDSNGMLVADYINGSVVAADLNARFQSSTPNGFLQAPSSVRRADGRLGLAQDALIVTERSANRVSVVEP